MSTRISSILFVTCQRSESDIEEVSIAEALESIIYVLQTYQRIGSNVEILRELPPSDRRCTIKVQPFVALVENLLRNACEAAQHEMDDWQTDVQAVSRTAENRATSPARSSIRLSVELGDDTLQVQISDTGPGFPFPYTEQVGAGTSIESGFSTKPGHTGTGLSIVRTATEQLRAQVLIRSIPGRGTTATAQVPLEKEATVLESDLRTRMPK